MATAKHTMWFDNIHRLSKTTATLHRETTQTELNSLILIMSCSLNFECDLPFTGITMIENIILNPSMDIDSGVLSVLTETYSIPLSTVGRVRKGSSLKVEPQ